MNKLIAAVAKNNLLGAYNARGVGYMPWPDLEEDLDHFKQVTMGNAMVMGSETLVSLPGMLPGREHRVLTRNQEEVLARLTNHSRKNSFLRGFDEGRLNFFSSLDEALDCEDPFITGGASVYRQCLERDLVDKMYLTFIDQTFDRNLSPKQKVLMPQIPFERFREDADFEKITLPQTPNTPAYTICAYKRK